MMVKGWTDMESKLHLKALVVFLRSSQALQEKLLASSSITYVVDKLENKGFVERKACKTDRRVTYAHITEEGRTFMAKVFPEHEETIKEIFGDLSEEELKEMIELMKKVGLPES